MNRKYALIILVGVIIINMISQSMRVEASVPKIKALTDNMCIYEYMILPDLDLRNAGDKKEVVLTDVEKVRAVAFTAPRNEKTIIGEVGNSEFGSDYIYSISTSYIKKRTKNMFGKGLSYKKLPTGRREYGSFLDVYINADGKPEYYVGAGETETDYEVIRQTKKKINKGYIVKKDVFWGYWGINARYNHELANYRITYTIKKDKESSYGYVITRMKVEMIVDLKQIDS